MSALPCQRNIKRWSVFEHNHWQTCFAAARLTSRIAFSWEVPWPSILCPPFTSTDTNASVCSITREPPLESGTLHEYPMFWGCLEQWATSSTDHFYLLLSILFISCSIPNSSNRGTLLLYNSTRSQRSGAISCR